MPDRQTCIECGTLSPETETNYTLISSQFGWRLTRNRLLDGTFAVEWRCPNCWKAYKQRKLAAEEARRGGMPAAPPASPVPAPSTRPLPSFRSSPPPPPRSSPPPPPPRLGPQPPGPIPPRIPRTRG